MAQLLTGTKIGQTTLAQGVNGTVTLPSVATTLMVANSPQNSTGGLMDYSGTGNIGATAYVYSNVSRTVTHNTATTINCNYQLYNTNTAVYSQSGGGLQVLQAGVYTISGKVSLTAGAITYLVGIAFYAGGASYNLKFMPAGVAYTRASGAITLPLAANDIVYLQCFQNSGSDKTVNGDLDASMLCIVKEK